jgi:hypothetical protein
VGGSNVDLHFRIVYTLAQGGSFNLLSGYNIFGALGCVFWLIAYALVIWQGFREKTYGIPLVAICLNFSWEIMTSFFLSGPVPLWHFFDRAWLLFDVVIVWQMLKYGRDAQQLPEMKRLYFPIIALVVLLGFWGQYSFTRTYYDPFGIIIAFMVNLVMSVLFNIMYFRRRDMRGLSYGAAWAKMLGTLGTSIQGVFLLPVIHPKVDNFSFFHFLFGSIFFFDCVYIYLLWNARRAAAATVVVAKVEPVLKLAA